MRALRSCFSWIQNTLILLFPRKNMFFFLTCDIFVEEFFLRSFKSEKKKSLRFNFKMKVSLHLRYFKFQQYTILIFHVSPLICKPHKKHIKTHREHTSKQKKNPLYYVFYLNDFSFFYLFHKWKLLFHVPELNDPGLIALK